MPSIPKGTRDFAPPIMVKRNYIFTTIKKTFERYGYMPLETPCMEDIETLTGKYGDEGDKLIFRILDSGDFLKDTPAEILQAKNSAQVSKSISGKALRYDLTVPFARFVVMNRNDIAFPFKRYQIQPVWRADRPQRGRYREFYQCDVDVVGSDSLLYEVELVQIFDDVLSDLKIPSVIKLNNRKILSGIAEVAGITERMMEMTIAIDKLDKIGEAGVVKELRDRNFNDDAIEKISILFKSSGTNDEKISAMKTMLQTSEIGMKGIEELNFIFDYVKTLGLKTATVEFDATLARGLNYYTGAIFEVKVRDFNMGSICGGGRYDDLTGIFGMPGVSGVGISFGADRIYDVMSELKLFPDENMSTTKILFANFGKAEEMKSVQLASQLRMAGINSEVYPDAAKMKKQFKYADDKNIPLVAIIGEDELKNNTVTVKDMKTGEQKSIATSDLITTLQ